MSGNKAHNWKSTYHSIFDQRLQEIKNEGHYRYFNEIERKAGQYPKALHHKDGNHGKKGVCPPHSPVYGPKLLCAIFVHGQQHSGAEIKLY